MSKTRPKIEQTVLRYASMAELPPIDELVHLAETYEWLQIEVATYEMIGEDGRRFDPTREARDQITQCLIKQLPGHTVYSSWIVYDEAALPAARRNINGFVEAGTLLTGWDKFGTRRNMPEEVITGNLDTLLVAANDYENYSNTLMACLARQLGVDVSDFTDLKKCCPSWWDEEQEGRLEIQKDDPAGTELWSWFFHGHDCGFCNAKGVLVEGALGLWEQCGDNFGRLTTHFFLEFIQTSDAYSALADILRDWEENLARFLYTAEQQGFLHSSDRGWLLTDLGRQRAEEARTDGKTAHA